MKKSYHLSSLALLGLLLLWSNVLFAQTAVGDCPIKGNKNSTWINNLKIGIWNHQSGNNNGYQAVGLDWPLQSGNHYTLQLDMGGVVRIQDTLYWRIWADFNGDHDFEDAGELLFQTKTMQRIAAKGELKIPKGLFTGTYLLRAILSKKGFTSACGAGAEVQEVEEYQFNIQGIDPCPPVDTQNIQIQVLNDSMAQFILHNPDASAYWLELYDGDQNLLQTYRSPDTDTLLLPGLHPGGTYGVRVQLSCPPAHFSKWSSLVKFDVPIITCTSPSLEQFKVLLTDKKHLQFIADVPALSYRWRVRLQEDSTWTNTFHSDNDTLTLESPNRDLFMEYQVAIECKNRAYSEWSESKTFKKLTCKLPHPILITAQYNLFYHRLELSGGIPAQLYRWRLRAIGDSIWHEFTTTQHDWHFDTTFANSQEVQLQMVCEENLSSEWSAIVQVNTIESFCTQPEPQHFYVQSTGENRYQFIATIPAEQYYWRYRIPGTTVWENYSAGENDTLNHTLPYDYNLTLELQLLVVCKNQPASTWSASNTFHTNVVSCVSPAYSMTAQISPYTGKLELTSLISAPLYHWRLRAIGDTIWKLISTSKNLLFIDTAFYEAQEIQLQILCSNGKLSAWSVSKIIPKLNCPRIKTEATQHFDYFHGGMPAVGLTWLSKIFESSAPAIYRWSYREEGLEQWSSFVKTSKAVVGLEGMTPGKTYAIRMEILCGQDTLNPPSVIELKQMPVSCVEIDPSTVKLKAYATSIEMDFPFPLAVPYDIRIRPKDSLRYNILRGLGQWGKQFTVVPGTTYEITLRGYCYDGTELPWSEPLYIKTLDCPLPRFGKIEMEKFALLDSITFNGIFERPNPQDTASWIYHWQYRIRDSATWTKTGLSKVNFPYFVVRNLRVNTNYELQLVTHCIHNPLDSFILVTYFSTDSAQCGEKPDTSVLDIKMAPWPNTNRWVTCKLPDPYLWEARVLKRQGNEWVVSPNEVYRRIPPTFRVNVEADEAMQFRLICPNNNVGPWSEIIVPGNFIQAGEPVLLNQGFVAKAKLSIAPNPNQGYFNISLPTQILNNEGEEAQVEVYNLAGQRIFISKIPFIANGVFALDLQGQGAGLYILKVQIGQQRFSEKLIISKH